MEELFQIDEDDLQNEDRKQPNRYLPGVSSQTVRHYNVKVEFAYPEGLTEEERKEMFDTMHEGCVLKHQMLKMQKEFSALKKKAQRRRSNDSLLNSRSRRACMNKRSESKICLLKSSKRRSKQRCRSCLKISKSSNVNSELPF